MARNLGREFATMTDEERRRFELKQRATAGEMPEEEAADELDMEDPREAEPTGADTPHRATKSPTPTRATAKRRCSTMRRMPAPSKPSGRAGAGQEIDE